jgi:YVTN family beta-propeller protein
MTAAAGLGIEFRILGTLEVIVGGEERPVLGEKLQALLGRLLLEANRPVSSERLIDDLWGDRPPATARQSLHAHVTRLRRLLATDDAAAAESPLVNDARGYLLRVDEDRLDAARFRRLVAEARTASREGDAATAGELCREALTLWRGPVLDGVQLEGADGERVELEGLRLAALEERVDADLALGAAAELVPELEQLVRQEPLREGLWARLMLALYASGRQADALVAYQRARAALAELGLEPGPTLRDLEQRILNQDPALTTEPLRAAGSRPRGLARRGTAAVLAVAAALIVVGIVVAARDDPPMAAAEAAPLVKPDSLVEIDPATSRTLSVTPVGHGPESIASTADAIWVANTADRTVSRLDLDTRQVRVVGGVPVAHALTSSLKGDVWLSSFEDPLVTQIASHGELADDAFSTSPPQVRLPGSAEGLAVGGGYLWVTSPSDSGGEDTVSLIDLATRKLASSVPVGTLPLYVAFGYGSAWVANYRGDSVSVVRPGSARAETVAVKGGPMGVAAGAGAIWVVTFWNTQVARIDPETRRVVRRIRVGPGPLAVAVGGGSVWVTNRDEHTITRIDPKTNRVTRTIQVRAAPYGVHFAHGRLWVTTQKCGSPVAAC